MQGSEPEIEPERDRQKAHPGGCMWRRPHLCLVGVEGGEPERKRLLGFELVTSGSPGNGAPASLRPYTAPHPTPSKLDYLGLVSSHFRFETVPGRKGWVDHTILRHCHSRVVLGEGAVGPGGGERPPAKLH